MVKKCVTALCLMLLIPMTAFGLSAKARVDKNRMSLDENLALTVTVDEGKAEIDTSKIVDFQIVSHTTGSSFQWINGRSFSEYTHVYTLSPVKKGRLTIPPLSVTYKNERTSTEKIDVVVEDNPKSTGIRSEGDIFVKASVNDDSPYPGQQIVYTFALYYTMQISGPTLNLPDFRNFSVKESDKDRQYSTTINGREYQVIERNVVLDPVKPGSVLIPPSVLNCKVAVVRGRRSADPFDSFFNDPFFNRAALVPKTLRTNPVSVRVIPLPPNPHPVPFSGLVGQFELKASLEPSTLNVGDSTTLSLTVAGRGNIKDAIEPEIKIPPAFKMYKDSPLEDIRLDNGGYLGNKTFRLALVALEEGRYTIPPVSMTCFDIEKGIYKVLTTPSFTVTVNPSPDGSVTPQPEKSETRNEVSTGSIKRKVEFTGHDILPLKESLEGARSRVTFTFTGFVFCLLVPAFVLGLVKLLVRLKKKNKTPSMIMAERAEKSLKEAGKPNLNDREFLSSVYLAFVSRVFAKGGVTGEILTGREVRTILSSSGCDPVLVDEAVHLLDRIEGFRFTGKSLDSDTRKKLLEETRIMSRRIG